MFEIVTYAYASAIYTLGRGIKIEKETIKSLTDPGTFISGAIAGGVGRAAALPFDKGGIKGISQTVARRMPQYGLLMMFYCPVAHKLLPGLEEDPRLKMYNTFLIGAAAGFNMRLLANPINRVMDESMRVGKPPMDVARVLKNKTVLQFYYTMPNLLCNAVYFGTLFTVFEGLRRFNERNFLPIVVNAAEAEPAVAVTEKGEVELTRRQVRIHAAVDRNWNYTNYVTNVVSNFLIGGAAAAVASTVCYPLSAHQYLQTVIHDSALCRGLMPTLRKEVPMVAVMFGVFSAIQPFLAPRHGTRCGFGY